MKPVVKLRSLFSELPCGLCGKYDCRCYKCKCDLSKPRKLEDTLPNAEALQAAGICMWCGFPED